MMGVQEQPQSNLFHFGVNLDKRIRINHPLRKVEEFIDFHFVYKEVKSFYGHNGNESVPPPVILKLMLLLAFYNVRSERELMETLPERMDWLWFLGCGSWVMTSMRRFRTIAYYQKPERSGVLRYFKASLSESSCSASRQDWLTIARYSLIQA